LIKNIIKIKVFWDMIQCSLVDRHQHSEEICCHLQGRKNCVKTRTRAKGKPVTLKRRLEKGT
jgi:hypothetical protein